MLTPTYFNNVPQLMAARMPIDSRALDSFFNFHICSAWWLDGLDKLDRLQRDLWNGNTDPRPLLYQPHPQIRRKGL